MKMTKEELGALVKDQFDKAIAPLLEVNRPKEEDGEKKELEKKLFPTFADFVKSVVQKDAKLMEYREKVLQMGSDPEGGYLIPEEFIPELRQVASEEGIIRSLATVLPASKEHPDTAVEIPVLDQAGASEKDFFSGVWFVWTAEGGDKQNKEPKFDNVKLEPQEYSAYAVLTDKLIRNASVLGAYVKQVYSRAQVAFEDYHFLRGTGVGQPLGIINSPAYITVTRNTKLTVVWADIQGMLTQILPGCNPIWVISRSLLGAVTGMADAAGNSIFIQGDATKKLPDRLSGYPIRWTFRVPAAGTQGDISLIDPSYYLIKDGYGPAFDESKHVYFLSNKTCLKMFGNVDGQPWLSGTITAEDGATEISPFVGLTTKLT
jgi:HK97 family phage major capsid protein